MTLSRNNDISMTSRDRKLVKTKWYSTNLVNPVKGANLVILHREAGQLRMNWGESQ
jgi:hypothetical protein